MTNTDYIYAELFQVAPLPVLEDNNGQIRIKLKSSQGETKWLNITPEQMEAIEWILLGNKLIKQ